MNASNKDDLIKRINLSQSIQIAPLSMKVQSVDGSCHEAIAINEVSLLRETHQASKIKISIDDKVRLEELICDNDTNFDKNLESIGKYEVNEITKESFQLALNNNLMAKSKLSDGIKKFVEDTISLEQILQNLFSQTLSAS